MLVYVDTCVYRDYFESRKSRFLDIGYFASEMFLNGINCHYSFLVSDWLLTQLKEFENTAIYQSLFEDMKKGNKMMSVKATEKIKQRANNFPTEHEDAVHALIAIENNATYLITRNIKDYACFKDEKMKIRLPENIEY